jgi:hypothetical protein
MAISQSRKWNMISLAALMLAGTAAAWGPIALARWQLHRFCTELQTGTPAARVEAAANERGYDVTPLAVDRMHVEDPRTLGRGACVVRFGAGGLLSAE